MKFMMWIARYVGPLGLSVALCATLALALAALIGASLIWLPLR
jgi:hypothetical protein